MSHRREKLSRMRKLIGDNMRRSSQEIPQASGFVSVDFTELLELQQELREQGKKVSDTIFLVKAVVEGLKERPELNARLEGDEAVYYDDINAGVAANTPNGLMVITLRRLQDKSLLEIAELFRDTMGRMSSNKLTMDDISGSTFTVSSLSKSRLRAFSSIINNNECFILGMAGIHKEPVVLPDGSIAARDICNIIVNMNHVLVDGVSITAFLERVCGVLEHPRAYMD